MKTLHLTLKMTITQVFKTSVANNGLSEDYTLTQTITQDKQLISPAMKITLDVDSNILLDSFSVARAAAMSSFLPGSFKS